MGLNEARNVPPRDKPSWFMSLSQIIIRHRIYVIMYLAKLHTVIRFRAAYCTTTEMVVVAVAIPIELPAIVIVYTPGELAAPADVRIFDRLLCRR